MNEAFEYFKKKQLDKLSGVDQTIAIRPGVLKIKFLHDQQLHKPVFVEISSMALEQIIADYCNKNTSVCVKLQAE